MLAEDEHGLVPPPAAAELKEQIFLLHQRASLLSIWNQNMAFLYYLSGASCLILCCSTNKARVSTEIVKTIISH